MTRKLTFFVGLGALAMLVTPGIIAGNYYTPCWFFEGLIPSCRVLEASLLPFISLLPFSFILYFLRDEVFNSWWNFARGWVATIIVATIFFAAMRGGGSLNAGQDFTILVLGILYAIFIVGSIVKIVQAYLETRGK